MPEENPPKGRTAPRPLRDDVRRHIDDLPPSHRPLFDRLHSAMWSGEVVVKVTRRHPRLKTNKASIQFPLSASLPEEDIREVVRRATR